jgi:S1-C subfamily serine protease
VTPLGSGFLVSAEGHLVTARHVITNGLEALANHASDPSARLIAALPASDTRGNPIRFDLSVIAEHPETDLALAKLAPRSFSDGADRGGAGSTTHTAGLGIARLSLVTPQSGTAVALAGYPAGERQLIVSAGRVIDERLLDDDVLALDSAPGWLDALQGRGLLFADFATRRGHSGGPVFLAESGEVVGVCVSVVFVSRTKGDRGIPFRVRQGSGLTLVIPARDMVALLNENGVAWREAG